MAETNTATELAGLKTFLASALPAGAKTVLNQWPKEPVEKTLVIRSMPDDYSQIATDVIQVVKQYQILYVDKRIDTVKGVTDVMKMRLSRQPDIPLDDTTKLIGRIDGIAGGQPFKTEQSTPLDGDYFTLRLTTFTAFSDEAYETIKGVALTAPF